MAKLQLPAYTPALYLPGHYGRYRSYPYNTTTPIPGAGYHPARLRWGEQELNLDGARPGSRYVYGNYVRNGGVPLLGLGQAASGTVFSRFAQTAASIWGGAAAAPVAYAQLVEYAKITAVGTFVGIPLAMAAGYFAGKKRRVRSNRRRR